MRRRELKSIIKKGYGNQLAIDWGAEIKGGKTVMQLVSILAQYKILDKFESIKLDLRRRQSKFLLGTIHALKNGHRYEKDKQSMHIKYEQRTGYRYWGSVS